MGDNLAQLLYTAFVNAGMTVAGGDVPNWASLPAVDRDQWEQVAVKARREMVQRFVASIDATSDKRIADGDEAIAALRLQWAR